MGDILQALLSAASILGGVLVVYIFTLLLAFVIIYEILFDPRATTVGRFNFRFIISILGIAVLAMLQMLFGHDAIESWYPYVRLFVFAYAAYTATALVVVLFLRKWWPHKLRTSSDLDLVKVRTHEHI